MDNSNRKILEESDTALLIKHYYNQDMTSGDIEACPSIKPGLYEDLWSKALEASSGNDDSKVKEIRARLRVSDMPAECVIWWNKVLAVADQAPLQEYEKLLRKRTPMPMTFGTDCFDASGDLIAVWGMRNERRKRNEAKKNEEQKLEKLKSKMDEARHKLSDAQNNLSSHVRSR